MLGDGPRPSGASYALLGKAHMDRPLVLAYGNGNWWRVWTVRTTWMG